jgi:hypothetical protein
MRLAVFSPYGSVYRQGGLLFLVTNYLSKLGAETTVLRCDGAVKACRRDSKAGQKGRTISSCITCAGEQAALATWASVRMMQLSSFITAEDVLQGSMWIADVPSEDLCRLEFKGESLWQACAEDVQERFPQANPDALRLEESVYVRNLYSAYIQTAVATERFLSSVQPTITLIAAAGDALSRAYLLQAQRLEGDVAVFSYDANDEAVAVESLRGGSRYTTKVVLDGITSMRSDPRTWGPEVTSLVHDILTVLGYGPAAVP